MSVGFLPGELFGPHMEDASRHLAGLYDREIYTTNGTRIGTVSDAIIDFQSGEVTHVVVESLNSDVFTGFLAGHRGIRIPFRWIRNVNDVVIVIEAVERVSEDTAPDIEAEF